MSSSGYEAVRSHVESAQKLCVRGDDDRRGHEDCARRRVPARYRQTRAHRPPTGSRQCCTRRPRRGSGPSFGTWPVRLESRRARHVDHWIPAPLRRTRRRHRCRRRRRCQRRRWRARRVVDSVPHHRHDVAAILQLAHGAVLGAGKDISEHFVDPDVLDPRGRSHRSPRCRRERQNCGAVVAPPLRSPRVRRRVYDVPLSQQRLLADRRHSRPGSLRPRCIGSFIARERLDRREELVDRITSARVSVVLRTQPPLRRGPRNARVRGHRSRGIRGRTARVRAARLRGKHPAGSLGRTPRRALPR